MHHPGFTDSGLYVRVYLTILYVYFLFYLFLLVYNFSYILPMAFSLWFLLSFGLRFGINGVSDFLKYSEILSSVDSGLLCQLRKVVFQPSGISFGWTGLCSWTR